MKKIILGLTLFLSAFTFLSADAQLRSNISSQPAWGPTGYDYVNYYYFPDIDTYYDVPRHQYVHMNPSGKWVFSNGLPAAYRNYDLYNGYKVVLNDRDAYKYNTDHKIKYAGYKGKQGQNIIKNSNEEKYKVKEKPAKSQAKMKAKNKAKKNR